MLVGAKGDYQQKSANEYALLLITPFPLLLQSELSAFLLPHEWPGQTEPKGTLGSRAPQTEKAEARIPKESGWCKSLICPSCCILRTKCMV